GQAFSGVVAFLTVPFLSRSAQITWGDGHTSAGLPVRAGSGYAIWGTNTFAAAGTYHPTVSVLRPGAGPLVVQSTLDVAAPAPPPAPQAGQYPPTASDALIPAAGNVGAVGSNNSVPSPPAFTTWVGPS